MEESYWMIIAASIKIIKEDEKRKHKHTLLMRRKRKAERDIDQALKY